MGTVTDFGADIACVTDIDPAFAVVTGTRAVSQALARRLGTPRGGLFYDGEYGFDLRRFANSDFSQALAYRCQAGIEAECLRDERVRRCSATVTYSDADDTLRIRVDAEVYDGAFSLVLAVSAVTVTILGGA